VNSEKADPAMRWQKWKLHLPLRARGEIELYDLSNDPRERNNLAHQKKPTRPRTHHPSQSLD
jgi:N-acetylgalactosamine-6-sulfatase